MPGAGRDSVEVQRCGHPGEFGAHRGRPGHLGVDVDDAPGTCPCEPAAGILNRRPQLERTFDRVLVGPSRRLRRETETDLGRDMYFPVRWELRR